MAGVSIDAKRAEAGLALLQKEEDQVDFDMPGATACKEETEAQIAKLEEQANALTGKENKKARNEISKEISAIKNKPEYIDACKVIKGQTPKNGFFAKITSSPTNKAAASPTSKGSGKGGYSAPEAPAAPAAPEPEQEEKKAEKEKKEKPKKVESTGLSRDERNELEKLKTDIIAKKKELKEAGMSGAQCNKDPEVVGWVARMQELKIKEDPSLAEEVNKKGKDKKKPKKGALSSEEQVEFEKLQRELEQYRQRLISEFGYTKKDIANDPDFKELQEKVAAFEKRV